MENIISQKIQWNQLTNECFLETLYSDERKNVGIKSERITSEEAAQWKAENEY